MVKKAIELAVAAGENVNNTFADQIDKLSKIIEQDISRVRRNEADFIRFLQDNDVSELFLETYRELLCRYSSQGIFTTFYPEYLLRKNQGSAFLLDTGNLVVDIIPGTGSSLESFKLMHRGLDVLKVLEEKIRMELENKRRDKLIDAAKYGDPDIEKVTIVTGAKEAAGLIATSIGTEAGGEASDVEP